MTERKKYIFRFLLIIFIISLLPILALAGYNYPCADDFSASDTVYFAWRDTGSLIQVLRAAMENVRYNYMEWSGVFASVFWTSLQPGIFGEQYYGITTWITVFLLCISATTFFYVILRKYMHADRYDTGIITISFLFLIIHCMPSGLEGLYWHAGVVNYTWGFAFLLLLTGVELMFIKEGKIVHCILASVLAVLVGGGNYITALQGCLWLCLIVGYTLISSIKKNDNDLDGGRLLLVVMPVMILLISFGASVLAPGNSVRMASSSGFGAVKAILVSFYYALETPVEEWLSWPIIMMLLFITPLVLKMLEQNNFNYPFPVVVVILGFCLLAAAFTPSLYAQGAMEAGRLHNTVYFLWIVILYFELIYVAGWWRKGKNTLLNYDLESIYSLRFMGVVLSFFILASLLCIMIDKTIYVGIEAFDSIVSGQASLYEIENEQRIMMLENSSAEDVEVNRFTNPPELLLFQDLSPDTNEWVNQVVAEYYEKNSVSTQ